MEVYGIVAEFNPFHNGHERLINALKDEHPTAIVAVVMSGAFTQRGEVAVYDKWTRARMALLSGADLVFELPQLYATASMAYFAKGAVETLLATGVLSGLAFGSESGDGKSLRKYGAILRDEPKLYRDKLKTFLKEGKSYSQAQYEALGEFFNEVPSKDAPNDRLAMQYLIYLPKELEVFSLKREVSHLSRSPSIKEASGSYLRMCLENNRDISAFIPRSLLPLIADLEKNWYLPKMNDYYPIMLSHAINLGKTRLALELELSDGFENRFFELISEAEDYDDFLAKAQTRQYSRARLGRLLLRLMSDRTLKEDAPVEYLRLLGASNLGKMALHRIEHSKKVPLINKVARSYPLLSKEGRRILDLDIKRQNLQILFQNRKTYPFNLDFYKSPVMK